MLAISIFLFQIFYFRSCLVLAPSVLVLWLIGLDLAGSCLGLGVAGFGLDLGLGLEIAGLVNNTGFCRCKTRNSS